MAFKSRESTVLPLKNSKMSTCGWKTHYTYICNRPIRAGTWRRKDRDSEKNREEEKYREEEDRDENGTRTMKKEEEK